MTGNNTYIQFSHTTIFELAIQRPLATKGEEA